MMDDFYKRLDEIYYPTDSIIAWIYKCLEDLRARFDQVSDTVKKLERHRTKREKSIRCFLGTWFEISEDVSQQVLLSLLTSLNTQKRQAIDYKQAINGRQPIIRYFI